MLSLWVVRKRDEKVGIGVSLRDLHLEYLEGLNSLFVFYVIV